MLYRLLVAVTSLRGCLEDTVAAAHTLEHRIALPSTSSWSTHVGTHPEAKPTGTVNIPADPSHGALRTNVTHDRAKQHDTSKQHDIRSQHDTTKQQKQTARISKDPTLPRKRYEYSMIMIMIIFLCYLFSYDTHCAYQTLHIYNILPMLHTDPLTLHKTTHHQQQQQRQTPPITTTMITTIKTLPMVMYLPQ